MAENQTEDRLIRSLGSAHLRQVQNVERDEKLSQKVRVAARLELARRGIGV